jgi:hypothetical protein
MNIKIIRWRLVFSIAGTLLAVFIAWKSFHYFFDKTPPELTVTGIQEGNWYKGDIQGMATGNDGYKVSTISVWLDHQALVNHFAIHKKTFEYPFSIASKTLPDGIHTLAIEVVDGSFHKNTTIQSYHFYVDNTPIQAALIKTGNEFKVFQGNTLHLQLQASKELYSAHITILGNTYPFVQETPSSHIYECFVPIDCETKPNEYQFSITLSDHVGNVVTLENKFSVIMFPFKKQALNITVPENRNTNIKSPEQFENSIKTITTQSPAKKLWQGTFYAPLNFKKVSTEFGTIRTTTYKGKYVHKALDLVAPLGGSVWAPQDGIVALKDTFSHSGNTIVIDHGYGILSIFFHLNKFATITIGQHIKKGAPLGLVGTTGISNGPHLHWEMRVNNIAINPLEWTKNDF